MAMDWWTLGFQTVNILILIWLLQRFFWKPIAAMIAERREVARKALSEAEAARTQAKAELAEIDKTRAGFAAERLALLAAASVEAKRNSAAEAAEGGKAADALIADATATIAKEKESADKVWAKNASDLAIAIAERLAARLDGRAVRGIFLDWALSAIRALPPATREAATKSSIPLQAACATPLDAAEQSNATARIGEALGAPVTLTFKTDPDLIAGLEIHSEHLVVSNSWRADLADILGELAHER